MKVERRENETFEKMYKRFRKLVEKEQIISTYMRTLYYMKPSEKKRYKAKKAEMRRKKLLRKIEMKLHKRY